MPEPADYAERSSDHVAVAEVETRGVERLLAAARERIERFAPEEAWAAAATGEALIVDLRSGDERRRHGIVPGSVHVPRSVLEWRADPTSDSHNPQLEGRGRLILLCAEGYSSSLAAASLVELGRAGRRRWVPRVARRRPPDRSGSGGRRRDAGDGRPGDRADIID